MEVILEILIIFFALSGLVLHSRVGGRGGARRRHQFMYYTSLSNLIVLLYYAARFVPSFISFLKSPAVWFSIAMEIFITFVIYHFVIRKELQKKISQSGETRLKIFSYSNLSVHYFTPALTFLDWAVFADKNLLNYSASLQWVVIPLAYTAFCYARGAKGGNLEFTDSPYPYGFMDPILNGWKKTARNVLALSSLMLAAGFVIVWFFKKIY